MVSVVQQGAIVAGCVWGIEAVCVIGRVGYHGQDLTGSRLKHYNGTHPRPQCLLAQLLDAPVYGEHYVFAGHWDLYIALFLDVPPLCIHSYGLKPRGALEEQVVFLLYAVLSYYAVGCIALVVEQLQLLGVDVAHISDYMGQRSGMVIMPNRLAAPGDAGKILYIRGNLDNLSIGYIIFKLDGLEHIGLGYFLHKDLGVGAQYYSQVGDYLGQLLTVGLGRHYGDSEGIHIGGQWCIVVAVVDLTPQRRHLRGTPRHSPGPVLELHSPGNLHGEKIAYEYGENDTNHQDKKEQPLLLYALILKGIVAHFPPQISFGIRCVFLSIKYMSGANRAFSTISIRKLLVKTAGK